MTRSFPYLFLMFLVLLTAQFLSAQQIPPVVVGFPASAAPTVPADLKVMCAVNTVSGAQSATCPVIAWNGYIYWVFSYADNRIGLCIAAYTEQGVLVKRWEKTGARYVAKIGVDQKKRTVTLVGQSANTIVVGWDELYLPIAPEAVRMPSAVHPAIPAGAKITCMQSAEVVGVMDTCAVLTWQDRTYWAYSYMDNRMSLAVVAYNDTGAVVKQWELPGTRYIHSITVEPSAQTVTFWGQGNQKGVMTWKQLMIE